MNRADNKNNKGLPSQEETLRRNPIFSSHFQGEFILFNAQVGKKSSRSTGLTNSVKLSVGVKIHSGCQPPTLGEVGGGEEDFFLLFTCTLCLSPLPVSAKVMQNCFYGSPHLHFSFTKKQSCEIRQADPTSFHDKARI